jgi:hypothetical protein
MIEEMIWAFDSPGSVSKVLIVALLSVDPMMMRGADRATNNGNVPRGSSALSGAPNWLAAESVSAQWLPPRSINENASSMPIPKCE